ncbi:MAG: nitrous oxide reductase family maturation protein NosD [Cyclobacteriaceae bacterium]|nr:MAG: nitrous oxide reductase family maturation protein NosD [Cyclobacteriaceae bacterium]
MKGFVIIAFCFFFGIALGSTIPVGVNQPVKTIKQAIGQAKPKDTLLIQPGIYREGNIVLEKSVVIIGKGYPVLDGENKYEIFTIHADHVVISGLKFINTGVASINDLAAVKVLESNYLVISNNKLENTFFGIYLANSTNCRIEGNELQSNAEAEHQIGNGIHLWKCDHMTIHKNRIRGHRDGIYFEFVTESLITDNYSEGNMRYGLHFMFSHNDEYRNNTFINNGAGVAVMYTKGVKMINNTFEHNWGSSSYGLLLKDIRDSFVTGNVFQTNSVGIFMEGSSRISFRENTFSENGYAVRLQASCDDNIFERNNFTSNTFDLVTNGSLVLNTLNGNYWDHYEGYDLNHDRIGDVPYRPVSLYGMVIEQMPSAVMLWRSFFVFLMDRTEKAMPAITPENLKDSSPAMIPYDLHQKN